MEPFDPLTVQDRDEKRALDQREAKLQADNDLQFVMADARGRRFVWKLLTDAGVYRSSFATDALVMAHNEGKRDAGLRLLSRLLETFQAAYALMQTENTSGAA